VSRPPEGEEASAKPSTRKGRPPRRNWFEPLTLTIEYSGGPEAWVVVKTRGRTFRRPGHCQIVDLLADVNGR